MMGRTLGAAAALVRRNADCDSPRRFTGKHHLAKDETIGAAVHASRRPADACETREPRSHDDEMLQVRLHTSELSSTPMLTREDATVLHDAEDLTKVREQARVEPS